MINLFSVVATFGLVLGFQEGSEVSSKIVEIVPKKIYVPKNFDSNDFPEFIIEGEFESSCYSLREVKVAPVKDEQIYFRVYANVWPGPCTQGKTTYYQGVELKESLEEGQYPIWNVKSREKMGGFSIRHTNSTKRDDFPYAAVDSSFIYYDAANQRSVLTLFGIHKNSCTRFDKEKVWIKQTDQGLIEVLPIIKKEGKENCKDGDFKFQEKFYVPETIASGRYLFHMRTANGHSFNKIDVISLPGDSEEETTQR